MRNLYKLVTFDSDDYRNGYKSKRVNSSYGSMEIDVPQDRKSTFEPQVVKKRQKDISDIDQKIISMYAKTQNKNKITTMIKAISYVELFKGVGLDSIVSPKSSTATYIMRYVRSMIGAKGSEIEALHKLMEDKVEALEFSIKSDIRYNPSQLIDFQFSRKHTNAFLKVVGLKVYYLLCLFPDNGKYLFSGKIAVSVTGNDFINRNCSKRDGTIFKHRFPYGRNLSAGT